MMTENLVVKRKVCFVLPSLVLGGAEKVASIILTHLDRSKFDVKLVLFNKFGEHLDCLPPDLEIIDLHKKSRWDFWGLIVRLRKIVKREEPDILISFLEYSNIISVLSAILLKKVPKVIISERSNHRSYLQKVKFKWLKTILIKYTYRKAHKIIAVSKEIKRNIITDFRINDDKIEVIHNPIDITKVERLCKEEVNHRFVNKKDRFLIISVGRLSEEKNFDLLLRSFSVVIKENPAFLIIVGDGELRGELQKKARELDLENFVDFVDFQQNPFRWLSKADLFVLTSNWEGFPNVILEAMACGIPVISTDCPTGPREIIENNKNGILVPIQDARLLANAILALLINNDMRNRIKNNASQYVTKFNYTKVILMYEKVFLSGWVK